jgi:isopenicillin-N epimerase
MDRLSPQPPTPLPNTDLSRWFLREDITFLNHGSFGATPRIVMEEQDRLRRQIEAEPIELLGRQEPELVQAAKLPLAQFLHMEPKDFGLVTNATEGINAVLNSLRFNPCDELLTTTHVYNAVRQAMRHTAARHNATYREIDVPTPIRHSSQIVSLILDQLSDRTRLLVIDHITSPTALIFPVAEIITGCESKGVEVMIDGAHAPGMVDLNVPRLGATYYAGNLHKWACASKGCAFLWVDPRRASNIHPCTVSHLYGQGLSDEFSWQGTRDISAWLAMPAALQFMSDLGWENVRQHNHALAIWAHQMLCDRFQVSPISPFDGQLIGATATIPLPAGLSDMTDDESKALQQSLYTDDRIEIPLIRWQNTWHLRVSCQVYNRQGDYHRLADVILSRAKS